MHSNDARRYCPGPNEPCLSLCSRPKTSLGSRFAVAFRDRFYYHLMVPENPGADDDGDGYTNLEEWLAGF